jgi:hypothetical protein
VVAGLAAQSPSLGTPHTTRKNYDAARPEGCLRGRNRSDSRRAGVPSPLPHPPGEARPLLAKRGDVRNTTEVRADSMLVECHNRLAAGLLKQPRHQEPLYLLVTCSSLSLVSITVARTSHLADTTS